MEFGMRLGSRGLFKTTETRLSQECCILYWVSRRMNTGIVESRESGSGSKKAFNTSHVFPVWPQYNLRFKMAAVYIKINYIKIG